MQLNRKYLILLAALILSLLSGFVAEYLYVNSPEKPFSPKKFTTILHRKIERSEQTLQQLSNFADFENFDSITCFLSNMQDNAGYIFSGNELIFWNTNQFEIKPDELQKDAEWHFIQLNNAYGIYKWKDTKHGYGIVTFIPVKSAYTYENKYLKNEFDKSFSTDKNLVISDNKTPDSYDIFDKNNRLLFSLVKSEKTAYNDAYRMTGFISFTVAFLIFLLLYININTLFKSEKLKASQFWIATCLSGTVILILCYFDFPNLFFHNQLFSPQQYAASGLIKTFTHLSIISFFVITAIFIFHTKVDKKGKYPIFQRVTLYLYILFFFETVKSIILNSSISFNLLVLRENLFTNIWSQFLVFALATGLFFMLQTAQNYSLKINFKKALGIEFIFILLSIILYSIIFQKFALYFIVFLLTVIVFDFVRRRYFKNRFNFNTFAIYFFILNFVILIVSYQFNDFKKFNKYKILSENILVNGNSENDPIAELLLEELDKNIREDQKLNQLLSASDSIEAINNYVFNNYLRGFWNKYDISIKLISRNSFDYEYYKQYLQYTGKKLKETGFYSLPASLYDLSFIGLIEMNTSDAKDNNLLVLEFLPKRNFRSYSFPDLLISNESNILNQLNISIAKYEGEKLIYSDLKHDWPENDTIFQHIKDGFEQIKTAQRKYYVLTKSNLRIVITRISTANITTLYYYFIFSFLFCLLLGRILFWIYDKKARRKNYVLGLTTKFQLVFISLLFMSFMGILIFSTNYIRNNYEQDQISNIEKKKQYLQKSLQDLYYWTEDIATIDAQGLKNNLEELAYRYQTDINIYNNDGKLMGSSQPLIFSKHLLGQVMSPAVFFSNKTPENQYEKIGNLSYLAAYTDMINGDYLQIGYISIPQYLSQTEINAKIEQFLLAIIQIYLIIIVFSIILIIIAGKQLADPLYQLENKLKSMHLGGKNEKVEYKWKDEIGQLVEQYNRTVDELEKSTQLLLQSERETAWRTMARQVAHEINNPLTPMKLTIQQLMRTKQMNSESFDAYFEKAGHTLIEQIDNLSRIAGTFSQFARMPETKFSKVDVAAKLFSVVELFKNNHENIDINYSGEEKNIYVNGDAEQLIQVFTNILKNATQSIKSDAKGKISVELASLDKKIQIKVSDNGVGIPSSNRQDIFKPNFTTKSTGMGLGLSISKNFIENMGGKISFSSKVKAGTTFEILLPTEINEK